jgi:competence protein ComFC
MPVPEVVDRSSCLRCRDQRWRFERAIALGPYRGKLREAIILMKRPVFESLALAAGRLLAEKLEREQVAFDAIVPVPNHWTRRLAHKTSAAESLATAISRHSKRPMLLSLAKRRRRTQKQGMLAWSNRPENVKEAFQVRRSRRIVGKKILLVDDVLTSGATAAELTRCLLAAGAAAVNIAVAARGTGSRS